MKKRYLYGLITLGFLIIAIWNVIDSTHGFTIDKFLISIGSGWGVGWYFSKTQSAINKGE